MARGLREDFLKIPSVLAQVKQKAEQKTYIIEDDQDGQLGLKI